MVYSTRQFVLFCLVLFCSCVFSPLSIAITSLEEEIANLSASRRFVRFALVWLCLFLLPLGVWEGLRLVIVALPELFSYFFTIVIMCFYNQVTLGHVTIVMMCFMIRSHQIMLL